MSWLPIANQISRALSVIRGRIGANTRVPAFSADFIQFLLCVVTRAKPEGVLLHEAVDDAVAVEISRGGPPLASGAVFVGESGVVDTGKSGSSGGSRGWR